MSVLIVPLVFLLAGLVHGFLGFGSGIVAMSILVVTHGMVAAAGLVNIQSLLISGLLTALLWRHVDWRLVAPLLVGGATGIPFGVWLLGSLDPQLMVAGLGIVIILIAAYSLSDLRPKSAPPVAWALPAGLVSGFFQGAMNTGGPPVIAYLYSQPKPPDVIKATISALFMAGALVRLPIAASQGQIGLDLVWQAALSLPLVTIGLAAGVRASRHLHPERFRRVSWWAFLALGLVLLLR